MTQWGNWGPLDGTMEKLEPLDNAMRNWAPWWHDGKLEVDPFDDIMRKLGALDDVKENLGPFDDEMGKLRTVNEAMGTLGALYDLMGS